ncbi:probable F-box protein At1g14315 [Syzygium oleosum]|uniref:probable F-box protein At1g14315 n=1 Tax=Syzygium oleosum TaxID=219896 RepID=UPI0024B8B341|nr:probable F-box protein At1g14315 [Syzygium oleosum]
MSSPHDDEDPKLPHDVAVEVLKRLPVESLLRFRCVCRSWRSAIDDPRFVVLHLTYSAPDASYWYLVSLDWNLDTVTGLMTTRLLIITCFPNKYGGCKGELVTDIYTLSTNLWRTVNFNFGCKLSDGSRVSFNGNLEWKSIGFDEDRCWCYGSMITSVVVHEAFDKMTLPKTCFA